MDIFTEAMISVLESKFNSICVNCIYNKGWSEKDLYYTCQHWNDVHVTYKRKKDRLFFQTIIKCNMFAKKGDETK